MSHNTPNESSLATGMKIKLLNLIGPASGMRVYIKGDPFVLYIFYLVFYLGTVINKLKLNNGPHFRPVKG